MHPRYKLPTGMQYSTLKERKEFYDKEFDLAKMEQWFNEWKENDMVKFAVIIGRHTRIFPAKYVDDASTTIIIDEYKDFEDLRRQILEFLPEAVYYDRNVYDEKNRTIGQELAFDLDPENLTCPIHGTLEDKMKRYQGLAFCELELQMVKEETIKLNEELRTQFSDTRIVYSGRGFHIHVFDKEPFEWSYKKRETLAKKLKKKGYLIDEWVTTGGMRLIRLPYSLHGMVSRIVLPVEANELNQFNPVTDTRCIPKFECLRVNSLLRNTPSPKAWMKFEKHRSLRSRLSVPVGIRRFKRTRLFISVTELYRELESVSLTFRL